MAKQYKVWICLEENDTENDTYEDIDIEGGPIFESDDKESAINFAGGLQKTFDGE